MSTSIAPDKQVLAEILGYLPGDPPIMARSGVLQRTEDVSLRFVKVPVEAVKDGLAIADNYHVCEALRGREPFGVSLHDIGPSPTTLRGNDYSVVAERIKQLAQKQLSQSRDAVLQTYVDTYRKGCDVVLDGLERELTNAHGAERVAKGFEDWLLRAPRQQLDVVTAALPATNLLNGAFLVGAAAAMSAIKDRHMRVTEAARALVGKTEASFEARYAECSDGVTVRERDIVLEKLKRAVSACGWVIGATPDLRPTIDANSAIDHYQTYAELWIGFGKDDPDPTPIRSYADLVKFADDAVGSGPMPAKAKER